MTEFIISGKLHTLLSYIIAMVGGGLFATALLKSVRRDTVYALLMGIGWITIITAGILGILYQTEMFNYHQVKGITL